MTQEAPLLFAQRLREERLHHRWSQQELADHLGTTAVTISRWENGVSKPSPYFRLKLTQLFDKPVDEFVVTSDMENLDEVQTTGAGQNSCALDRASEAEETELSHVPQDTSVANEHASSSPPSHSRHPFFQRQKRSMQLIVACCLSIVLLRFGVFVVLRDLPSPTPQHTALPKNGVLWYQADWSQGFDHWAGSPLWQWNSQQQGVISTQPTVNNNILFAPANLSATQYAVEAQIKRTAYSGIAGEGQAYGLVVHMHNGAGYICGIGVHTLPEHAFLGYVSQQPQNPSAYQIVDEAHTPVHLDTQWHAYRIEFHADSVTCFIDGVHLLSMSLTLNNQSEAAGSVGIYVDNAAITVQTFSIRKV